MSVVAAAVARLERRGVLRRNVRFRRMWVAQSISVVGDGVTHVALPTIAVLSLGSSTLLVAVLGATTTLAWPLVSLVAGVWVDRLARRPLLIAADLLRFVLIASVPLAYVFDLLTIWQLFVVAALSGVCSVFFGIAFTAHVRDIVDEDDLTEANARLELSISGADIAGPSAAGLLIGVLGAPIALVIDAVSYVCSALFIGAAGRVERATAAARKKFVAELRAGLSALRERPQLIRTMFASALSNLGFGMSHGILFVFAYRTLDLSVTVVGIALTLAGLGTLAGAAVAPAITARLGMHGTLFGASALMGLSGLLIPVATAGWPLLFLSAGIGLRFFFIPVWNVNGVTLRQKLVPPELQGRVSSATRTVSMGAWPIGSLLAGVLASVLAAPLGQDAALALTLTLSALVSAASAVPLIPSRMDAAAARTVARLAV